MEQPISWMKDFENPPNNFRPIPFWSWNDKLEKDELIFQIKEMKKAGVGGYFMHARSGLKVDYLSQDWFDMIGCGIEAGKDVGLDVWAYDEEGWPSGFAGGLVPAMSVDYQAKFMSLLYFDSTEAIDLSLCLGVYLLADNTYKKIDSNRPYTCGPDEQILAVIRHVNPFYIDTMNKKAVEAFTACTHDAYYERFSKDFGHAMKGFFTDEPRFTCDRFGQLPWSDDLPVAYKVAYGHDLLDHLPALFLDFEKSDACRYDFWTLVNRLFAENYVKTLYDWCESHHCKLTGHIMMEESIFSQMTSTGGVMPLYEYFHVPGIDWLRRRIDSPVIAKQVGSAACQLGKKQVLTESFALCGWDVSFEELKWIAQWQFVNGVNQICQHLQSYTIKGVRKRDYPPSLFIQQTWWDEYKLFNDYLGRLCVLLSQGKEKADVLLLHPMGSGFVSYDGTRTDAIRLLDEYFTVACQTLSGEHISYHLGDETLISHYGRVEKDSFWVGAIPYKAVVLPCMYAINKTTLSLLLAFIKGGGSVFSVADFPQFTNGDLSDLELLKEQIVTIGLDQLRTRLQDMSLVSISIQEDGKEIGDISFEHRQSEGESFLFLVNNSKTESYKGQITLFNTAFRVRQLVAENATISDLSYNTRQGHTSFDLSFAPMQSYCIELTSTLADQEFIVPTIEANRITLKPHWQIESMDLNSLTLDYCRYKIDDGNWEEKVPVISLQQRLLDLRRACQVEMAFDFTLQMDLAKNQEFYVVIEDAWLYEVTLNNQVVAYEDIGYWKDKSFRKVNIKAGLKNGSNQLILKTTFQQPQKVYHVLYGDNVYETEKNKITYDIELENIYLLGDFGVVSQSDYEAKDRHCWVTQGPFLITDKPTTLSRHDFTKDGLTFFAGQLQISQELILNKIDGQRQILDLSGQRAPLIKVLVNGQLVKDSLWAPYEADITDYIHQGSNQISLIIFASNRNLLGPHHHIQGECYNVGPESFTGKWSWVERESEADATEILDRDKNYWTDSYSFVSWGI